MAQFTARDIGIISDVMEIMKKNPKMYLNGCETPTGELLAARLISDLVYLKSLPAHVAVFERWWVITSDKDWLSALSPPADTKSAFWMIVPLPQAGPNSHRSEVLLTAFADAVVTCGQEGLIWIKGDPESFPLPETIIASKIDSGRLIAFVI
jgi:hypothetical protein